MNAFVMKIRSSVLHRFWRDHISDENGRRGDFPPYARAPLAVPTATLSFAMIVVDKVEGWNEEQWVGSKFTACKWIYTKAARCDGRRRPPLDLRQMLRIIMERASRATEDFLWEHESVTEPNVLLKENEILGALNYDIDVPCPLQWGLLWFSAPSSLNRKFANNGTREQDPEKLKILHMGGKLPTPTSIGNEFTSKTLGMARRKESRDETWYSGKTDDVPGKLGHQDGFR